MDSTQFWAREGLSHIIPPGFGEFPEGFDIRDDLKKLTEDLGYESLIDFGCGYGRLCQSFAKEKYRGLDVNEEALNLARTNYADYRFELTRGETRYADIYLAHTVFLHLKDVEVDAVLKQIRCKFLIISEILGKEWQRDGLPPVYNRDLGDYLRLLRSHDLVLERHETRPYKRYSTSPFYQNKNTDLSLLIFKKIPTYSKMT